MCKIILIVTVLLPALRLFSLVKGWTLIGTSSYFEVTRTTNTINQSIVESSTPASTLFQCLSSGINTFDVKSIFYDESNALCYRNKQFDNPSVSDDITGTIFYCEKRKSFEREADSIDRRITVEGSNYTSCMDVYDDGIRRSGVYKMGGSASNATNFYAPCNEGWIVFQRRQDGSVDFFRDWNDYVQGFGNKAGEFWLGLETIYQLTAEGNCELYIYLKAEDDNPIQSEGYARYGHFQLGNSSSNYTLSVSGFSGNVGDSFSSHNSYQFSTRDVDNDVSDSTDCANIYKGGWWYSNCHACNLNGLYLNGAHTSHANGIEWLNTWGYHNSLIGAEMRLRCN